MIKIYYLDRLILISADKQKAYSSDYQSVSYSDAESLKLEIINFIHNKKIKELNIFGKNPNSILDGIKQQFKLIIAGGGLVTNRDNKYLFIFRRKTWDLPKGKKEQYESEKQSALREVAEECNLSIDELEEKGFIGETFHLYYEDSELILKDTYWFDMYYSGDESVTSPQREEEIEECLWAEKSEIKNLMTNTFPSVLDIVTKKGLLN